MEQLFDRHRDQLRKMVVSRMDSRLASRVDPSDVIQETLVRASRQLPEYIRDRPLPFYPWLRQIAWQQLVDLNQRHIWAKKRSVLSEQELDVGLSDGSVLDLARHFVGSGTSPSQRLLRDEMRQRVRSALSRMESADREILLMRHVEQMRVSDIAALLSVSESAVKMRRLRAVRRLRELLVDDSLGADG